jgi:hypothetical protein
VARLAQGVVIDGDLAATSSTVWPRRWVSTFAPISPASRQVSGLPAVVTQIGNSRDTGRGWVARTRLAVRVGKFHRLAAPQAAHLSIASNIAGLLAGGVFSGRSTKSSGCQPEAMASPARPLVRLSITAHSSAMRAGWCSGATQDPARTPMLRVTAATAAPVTDGFG